MKTKDIHFITWILVSIILFGIIFLWNFQVLGQDWTPEQKEVWVSVQGFWGTIKNGDIEATLAGQHEKMLDWWSTNPDPLKEELLQLGYKNLVNQFKPTFVKLEPLAINIVKNVANVFYLFKWESANKEVTARGQSLITFVKQDNKWLMIGSLSSSCDTLPPCPYGW
jgi:hypothetical protein